MCVAASAADNNFVVAAVGERTALIHSVIALTGVRGRQPVTSSFTQSKSLHRPCPQWHLGDFFTESKVGCNFRLA